MNKLKKIVSILNLKRTIFERQIKTERRSSKQIR